VSSGCYCINSGKVGSVFVIEAAIQSKSKKMKKIPIVFAVIVINIMTANCQSDLRKEVGVVFRNIHSFGITYRTGTDRALWRISGFSVGASKDESYGGQTNISKYSRAGLGLQLGREFRKPITDQFQYRYGLDLACYYNVSTTNTTSPYQHMKTTIRTFMPGIVGVFGINFLVNSHFLVGAEIEPRFSYIMAHQNDKNLLDDTETERDIPGFNFSVQNVVALTLVYSFHKSDIQH
jgi:hypothetical protein